MKNENETGAVKYFKQVYVVILLLTLLWNASVFLAPLFMELGGAFTKFSLFIYCFFSPVCHQQDVRSFHLFGYKLAVCSRCVSIYLGFLIAVIFYPIKIKLSNIELPPLSYLLIPVLLIAADAFFDMFGLFANSFLSRSVTGAITGFVLPFFLIPGFVKLVNDISKSFFNKSKKI
ncbi:MAG: DUF2085 domain-containing protein [Ignavibacteria bacterium]|nr:DUF2085 domain-containing protein [Ignavibacteria bacterium]